jgi:Flp pilus assembly protein TadG
MKRILSLARRQAMVLMRGLNPSAALRKGNTAFYYRGRRGLARLRDGNEGGALVEFALVLPLMLGVVTAIFTYGIAFNNYIELTDGIGIAGRALAIARGNTLDPCNLVATSVWNASPNLTESKFTFTIAMDNGADSYSFAQGVTPTCSSASTTTGAPADLVEGTQATVTATYPCDLQIYGMTFLTACTLSSSVSELVQ